MNRLEMAAAIYAAVVWALIVWLATGWATRIVLERRRARREALSLVVEAETIAEIAALVRHDAPRISPDRLAQVVNEGIEATNRKGTS